MNKFRLLSKILLIVSLTIFSINSFAQFNDTIHIKKKNFIRYEFVKGNQELTSSMLTSILSSNLDAMTYMNKAKTNLNTARGFTFVAGLGLAYAIYSDLSGGDKVWAEAGLGALGLIGISIPLYINYNKKAATAVSIYNEEKKLKKSDLSLVIGPNNSGIGIALRF